jgi:hypothetical protein
VSGYAALRLPSAKPNHLVSHLILKSYIRKTSLSWSPVTESNRRPSPYHGGRFRLLTSPQVGLSQARRIPVSGHVALRLPVPGGVVTWLVTWPSRHASERHVRGQQHPVTGAQPAAWLSSAG